MALVGTLLAASLYMIGVKPVLLPIVAVINAFALPMPRVVNTVLARVIMGSVIAASLMQVAATFQLFIAPASDFTALAIIFAVLELSVLSIAPARPRPSTRPRLVDARDGGAALAVALFVAPFALVLAGHNLIRGVAQLAGVQAVDAIHHSALISDMLHSQHLDYALFYYPKGFHITVAFLQDSIIGSTLSSNWNANALLYFAEYLAFGSLLAYLVYLFTAAWLGRLAATSGVRLGRRWLYVIAGLALGPALALIYLIPFVTNGFVNYDWVCASLVASLLFFQELPHARAGGHGSVFSDPHRHWLMLAGLIIMFGASSSWPLLVPPAVFVALLSMARIDWRDALKLAALTKIKGLILLAALALQLIPVLIQVAYRSQDVGALGLNQQGGLSNLNVGVLLAGLLLIVVLTASRNVPGEDKHALVAIFAPLLTFVGLLVAEQYLAVGQIRYYAVKVSWFVEILVLALGVAASVSWLARSRHGRIPMFTALPAVTLGLAVLFTLNGDNLKDARLLLFGPSTKSGPPYYYEDVATFARLGDAGKLKHANATALHYDAASGTWYAIMQVPFWADTLAYDGSPADRSAQQCIADLYSELTFLPPSATQQRTVLGDVTRCATITRNRGAVFYVVTDAASAAVVSKTFGSIAEPTY